MSLDFIPGLVNGNSAAETAAASQQQANQQNYNMWLQSRGSGGSAVLPTYLQGSNGGLFEGQLGSDLVDAYGQTQTPFSSFQGATAKFRGAQNQADDFANSMFNGGVTRQLLNNAAPVQQAKVAFRKQTALDALHKTLDGIDATQAGKGYTGDSLGRRMLTFGANKGMYDSVAGANMENLQENRQIKDYGNVQLPMQNLTLPGAMAKQESDFNFQPQQQYLQSMQSRMAPFNFMKIGGGSGNPPQWQANPVAGPQMNPWAGALAGASQIGGSLLNRWLSTPSSNGAGYGYESGNGYGSGYGDTTSYYSPSFDSGSGYSSALENMGGLN